MEVLIIGRTGAGKTTASELFLEFYEGKDPLVITELKNLKDILVEYQLNTKIVLIETNPLILLARQPIQARIGYSTIQINEEDLLLKHLTELPNVHIITNNQDLSSLKVKIKRFIKNHL